MRGIYYCGECSSNQIKRAVVGLQRLTRDMIETTRNFYSGNFEQRRRRRTALGSLGGCAAALFDMIDSGGRW